MDPPLRAVEASSASGALQTPLRAYDTGEVLNPSELDKFQRYRAFQTRQDVQIQHHMDVRRRREKAFDKRQKLNLLGKGGPNSNVKIQPSIQIRWKREMIQVRPQSQIPPIQRTEIPRDRTHPDASSSSAPLSPLPGISDCRPPLERGQTEYEFQDSENKLLREVHAIVFQKGQEANRVPISSLIHGPPPESNDILRNCVKNSGSKPCWIHFPANNMSWVYALLRRLGQMQDHGTSTFLEDVFLADQYCLNQQNGDWAGGDPPQSKYMTPICQEILIPSENDPFKPKTPDSFAIFMPYLQWEKYLVQMKTQTVIDDIIEENNLTLSNRSDLLSPVDILTLRCREEEKLMRWYLIGDYLPPPGMPLHLRRTLDQAYYTKLNTRARDDDQVIFRYTRDVAKLKDDAMMLMVDQCWLWVINKNIIITCFPERQYPEGLGHERTRSSDMDDRVSTNILNWLSNNPNMIETAHDIATAVLDLCASNVISLGRTQNYEVKFIKAFQQSIGNVMDEQTRLFKWFLNDSRTLQKAYKREEAAIKEGQKERIKSSRDEQAELLTNLLNIVKETRILREIKDIMDELKIIKSINSDQSSVLKEFRDLSRVRLLDTGAEPIAPTVRRHQLPQQEKLFAAAKERSKIISDLYDDAEQAYQAIIDLLDLKQKHANVSEARSARKSSEEASKQAEETTQQGYSIMLFTIVTIIFLPLSSLASIFALLQVALKTMPIGISLAYILPISAFVIALSFLLAFHRGVRAWTIAHLKVAFGWIGHKTGFDGIFNLDAIQKWEKDKLEKFRKEGPPLLPSPGGEIGNGNLGVTDSGSDLDDDDDDDDDFEYNGASSFFSLPRIASQTSLAQASQPEPAAPGNVEEVESSIPAVASSRSSKIFGLSRSSRPEAQGGDAGSRV